MKILLSIALATILASLPVDSSMITSKNGPLNCDGLICPDNSSSCIISKKTFGDLSKYKYVRICTDEFGVPTDSKTDELENPSPGTEMNTISAYGVPTDSKIDELENPSPGTEMSTVSLYSENQELTEAESEETQEEIGDTVQETNTIFQETDTILQVTDTIVQETDEVVQETGNIVTEYVKGAKNYVKDTIRCWKNWTSDFVSSMKKMFPPGFPFVK
ncbi:uncharacterized protein LOC119080093 isoform X1 [Bradysia coprophila]|uniref:uncharacterized protein LOC119080093 isoform X1 n=1 Tax=Bradysia coprophila TaxID=38358 RepID=UPI00187D8329|nr:uncharacterized protein LOC119080093 isoform X1 [Bradysia coprophila]